jgi:predicted KAP-like P-loop ATPase
MADEDMKKDRKIKVITDEPNPTGVLDFYKYSEIFSNLIKNSSPRFSIGIFGEWGSGKTTLMRMIEKKIDTEQNIVTVWFDAWKYEREKYSSLIPFIRTIRFALDTSNKTNDKRWQPLKRAIKKSYLAFLKSTMITAGPIATDLHKFWNEIENNDEDLKDFASSLYYDADTYLQNGIKAILKEFSNFRFVIFIDDLDRCSPENALEVLDSIKSFFDFDGLIYVIGMNYDSINFLIKKKYHNNPSITGESYIKKIVQVPFQIPDWIEKDLNKFLEEVIFQNLTGYQHLNDFKANKKILLSAIEKNPRELKRFINNIILSKEILDTPTDKLMIIQALRFREEWNEFLRFILNSPSEDVREFFKEFLNSEEGKTSKRLSVFYHDLEKHYPHFSEGQSTLRTFLENNNVAKLLSQIEDFEPYRRAVKLTKLSKHSYNINERGKRLDWVKGKLVPGPDSYKY